MSTTGEVCDSDACLVPTTSLRSTFQVTSGQKVRLSRAGDKNQIKVTLHLRQASRADSDNNLPA